MLEKFQDFLFVLVVEASKKVEHLRWVSWGKPKRCYHCFTYIRRFTPPCNETMSGKHVPMVWGSNA